MKNEVYNCKQLYSPLFVYHNDSILMAPSRTSDYFNNRIKCKTLFEVTLKIKLILKIIEYMPDCDSDIKTARIVELYDYVIANLSLIGRTAFFRELAGQMNRYTPEIISHLTFHKEYIKEYIEAQRALYDLETQCDDDL